MLMKPSMPTGGEDDVAEELPVFFAGRDFAVEDGVLDDFLDAPAIERISVLCAIDEDEVVDGAHKDECDPTCLLLSLEPIHLRLKEWVVAGTAHECGVGSLRQLHWCLELNPNILTS